LRKTEFSPSPTVTVVMNVYKRAANFEIQLDAIRGQTHPVNQILVWENGAQSPPPNNVKSFVTSRSTKNLGVWARFAFALNAKTDFVWIIDDDTIPGRGWLENAIHTFESTPGIIGSRGLRFHSKSSYVLYDEFGPRNPSDQAQEVDIVGHNWIFPTAWLGEFWSELSNRYPSDLAGEDIHLSYAIGKHLGLGTFVPPHPASNTDLWGELPGKTHLDGTDDDAISRDPKSLKKFEEAYRHYIRLGFEPMVSGKSAQQQIHRYRNRALGAIVSRMPVFAHRLAKLLRFASRRS